MKIQLVGLVSAATLALCLVGCGDDTGGSGGGGTAGSGTGAGGSGTGATGTGAGGSGTGATGAGGSTGGASCADEADEAACRVCCGTTYEAGVDELQSLVFNSCCDVGGGCEAECGVAVATEDCGTVGALPVPDGACETCINALPSTAACALATIGDCNASAPCAEGLGCILGC